MHKGIAFSLGIITGVLVLGIVVLIYGPKKPDEDQTPKTVPVVDVEEGIVVNTDGDNVTSLFYTCDAAVVEQCLLVDGGGSTAIDCDPIPVEKIVEVCQ